MDLVSILIPARNEEGNIASTVEGIQKEFDQEGIPYEIIVVDDASTDSTGRVVKELSEADGRIHLVKNKPPYGVGNAIKTGLDRFKGECVIIAMADSSDDPRDMVKYARAIEKGYDCCFGLRWGKGAVVQDYPKHKFVMNRMVNWFIRFLFGIPYKDVTNAFKCYSKRTIQGIKPVLSRHFNITVELPLKAIVRGYSYMVIPTNWYARRRGRTKLLLKEMGSRYLFIIIYVFLEKLLCGSDYKKEEKTEPDNNKGSH